MVCLSLRFGALGGPHLCPLGSSVGLCVCPALSHLCLHCSAHIGRYRYTVKHSGSLTFPVSSEDEGKSFRCDSLFWAGRRERGGHEILGFTGALVRLI